MTTRVRRALSAAFDILMTSADPTSDVIGDAVTEAVKELGDEPVSTEEFAAALLDIIRIELAWAYGPGVADFLRQQVNDRE